MGGPPLHIGLARALVAQYPLPNYMLWLVTHWDSYNVGNQQQQQNEQNYMFWYGNKKNNSTGTLSIDPCLELYQKLSNILHTIFSDKIVYANHAEMRSECT